MSDPRLRELERRWRETGSPDDEAAYLLERVRVGDLARERLELAASCGHEGARRAVPTVEGRACAVELASLAERVPETGRASAVVAALAACEAASGAQQTVGPDEVLAVLAAKRWLAGAPLDPSSRTAAWRMDRRARSQHAVALLRLLSTPDEFLREWLDLAVEAAAELAGDAVVLEAVRRALVAWSLGGGGQGPRGLR